MAAPKAVRASMSFAVTVGKVEYFVREGELYAADHPAVKANPELFGTEVPITAEATAAPGRRRSR